MRCDVVYHSKYCRIDYLQLPFSASYQVIERLDRTSQRLDLSSRPTTAYNDQEVRVGTPKRRQSNFQRECLLTFENRIQVPAK